MSTPKCGCVAVADAAVGAVGGDDEVVAGPVGEVGARLMLEMEVDAERARPLLQDVQQPLAADADEAVARGADRLAVDVDLDIVPMGEFVLDRGAGDGIVGHQILDRLVGEDHAPAERVVGPVALDRGRSRAPDRAASSRSRNRARPGRRRGTRCACPPPDALGLKYPGFGPRSSKAADSGRDFRGRNCVPVCRKSRQGRDNAVTPPQLSQSVRFWG